MTRLCYLSLGSNLGDRAGTLSRAIAALAAHEQMTVLQVSPVYETKAVADEPQPDYYNLALALETELEPTQVLEALHDIERRLGRTRPYLNAPRTIDIDLLTCGDIMVQTPELTLPHPRMLERQFVVAPLADLDPNLRIGDNAPVGELVDRDDPEVRLVGPLADLAGKET